MHNRLTSKIKAIFYSSLIIGAYFSPLYANGPEDLQFVRNFVKSYPMGGSRARIRCALAEIPRDERAHTITAAKPLLTKESLDNEFLRDLGWVPRDKRDDIALEIKALLKNGATDENQWRPWDQLVKKNRIKRNIPQMIPEIIDEEMKSFLNNHTTPQGWKLINDAVQDIIPAERAHVIECVQRLMRDNRDGFQTASLIDVLGSLSREDRKVMMDAAEPLLKKFFQDMDDDQWAAIIELLSEIPMDRLSTMTTSQKLIFLIEKDRLGEFNGYRQVRYLTPFGGVDIDTGLVPISQSLSFSIRVKWQQFGEWLGYLRGIHS